MKKLFILLTAVAIMTLTSCQVKVKKDVKTQRFAVGTNYYQDAKTGAVYAIVVIKKPAGKTEVGVGIAYIPKTDLTPQITNQIKNYVKQ